MVTKNKTPAEVEAVTITMSRETAQAVKQACEEYLRFRMGQFEDFTNEVCCWDYVDKMEKRCHTTEERKQFHKDHEADFLKCIDEITESNQTAKIENRNGALFVNSIAVPGTFDDAPEFVRNRAVVAPATTEGFVNNTDPAGKPDKNDGGNDMEFKNADELRNGCPDLVKEIVDEAHAEAQKQERDRLAAIDEIADAVPSDLVAEAKYGDKACSAEQLAYRAALDAKKKGHKLLDDTEDDADTSGANSVGGAAPDGVSGTGTKNKNQTDAEKRAMVKNLFHPKKEG